MAPAPSGTGLDDGGYVPNIPLKGVKQDAVPSAPPAMRPPPMGEPDYNPAELFAAVKHRVTILPDVENPADDSTLDGVLFPGGHGGQLEEDGYNDVTAGLNPGYMTSYSERQTSGLMNT